MLTAAMTKVHGVLKDVWPSGVTLLHPDDLVDFEQALGPPGSGSIVVRYYQPQLARVGVLADFTAFVDVCSRRQAAAAVAAQQLLAAIPTTARSPSGLSEPRAVPIRETSYHRVAVSFTLLVDAIPEPPGS